MGACDPSWSAVIRKAQRMGLDFYDHYAEWNSWHADEQYADSFERLWDEIENSWEFWFGEIEPLAEAHVPFEVEAYVSSRSAAPSGLTDDWLTQHGFPDAPVHIVDDSDEKTGVLREKTDSDVFVDDKIQTVETLQKAYMPTNSVPYPILLNQPHNSPRGEDGGWGVWSRAFYLPEVPRIAKQDPQHQTKPLSAFEQFYPSS